jgi:hypothetical protein
VLLGFCSTALLSQAQTKPLRHEGSIIDPALPASFTLSRRTDHVVLPDSLRCKGLTGFIAVRVAITPTGMHRLVRVQKVRVTEPGQATLSIEFEDYQEPTIPYLIRSLPYFPLVVQYVQREVSFRPTHQVPVGPLTFMDFLVRLKWSVGKHYYKKNEFLGKSDNADYVQLA